MKPLYYFIIIDILLVIVSIKLIFKTAKVFTKAILGHIFSDFSGVKEFRKWDAQYDIHHKMNLLYAALLGIAILSVSLYFYLFTSF